jgi:hypothetical protein
MLLSGWTIAPIFTAQTGLPYTPTVTGNSPSGSGATGSGSIGAQGATRVPFLERNSFRLPSVVVMDLRISRSFRLWERGRVEIMGDAFNLPNHVNYTGAVTQSYTVGGTLAAPLFTYAPSFGTLTSANNNNVLSARQIQIGARFTF